jgi:two-component system LytT family response regulator
MEKCKSPESTVIEIKTEKGLKIIPIQKILFLKANKKNSKIQLCDSKLIICFNSLKWFSQRLKTPAFFRCHYSFIINCNFVDSFSSKGISLIGNEIIPLSRGKLPDLEKILAELQKNFDT